MVENTLAVGARGFGIAFVGVGFEVDIIHGILHQQIDLPDPVSESRIASLDAPAAPSLEFAVRYPGAYPEGV